MLLLKCGQCSHAVSVDPADRPPAWCPRCGGDLKQGSPSTLPDAPADAATPDPAPKPAPRSICAQPPAPPPQTKVLGFPLMPPREKMPLFVALVAFAVLGPIVTKVYQAQTSLEAFDNKIQTWMKRPSTANPPAPYVRGKVLPILKSWETTQNRGRYPVVDADLYWALPRDLRPGSPDEVGTALWLNWTETVRTAPGPNPFVVCVTACLEKCQLSLIDTRDNVLLLVKDFHSTDPDNPPPGRRGRRYVYGDPPYEEIVAFLKSLPRKDK